MRRVSPEETEGEEKERLALSCGEKGNKSSSREESGVDHELTSNTIHVPAKLVLEESEVASDARSVFCEGCVSDGFLCRRSDGEK